MYSLLGFLVSITVLVFIHELGHYLAALYCGVGVKRFSIGFGAPIFKKSDKRGCEWSVGWAPLGGYVLFEDSRNAEPGAACDPNKDFQKKKLWQKALIVAAGPLFNLLFALAAWSALSFVGQPEPVAKMGAVIEKSAAAQAGFQDYDTVLSVNGKPAQSLGQTHLALAGAALAGEDAKVQTRSENGQISERLLRFSETKADPASPNFLRQIGFPAPMPKFPALIGAVFKDTPADAAGVKAGETVVELDGAPVDTWSKFTALMATKSEKPMHLKLADRNGHIRETVLTPAISEPGGAPKIGVSVDADSYAFAPDDTIIVKKNFAQAVSESFGKVVSITKLTFAAIGKMVTGHAGKESVSGPIGIAKQAGSAMEAGAATLISFMGFLSLSLFIMNMLPVPALDGGHLVIYLCEAIRGKPLSEKTAQKISMIGFALLLCLMVFSIGNDISKLF